MRYQGVSAIGNTRVTVFDVRMARLHACPHKPVGRRQRVEQVYLPARFRSCSAVQRPDGPAPTIAARLFIASWLGARTRLASRRAAPVPSPSPTRATGTAAPCR